MKIAALVLIVLHGPDGREIDINVDEITAVHCKIPNVENKLFAEGISAVVSTTDGKNVSVAETCEEIRTKLKEAKP